MTHNWRRFRHSLASLITCSFIPVHISISSISRCFSSFTLLTGDLYTRSDWDMDRNEQRVIDEGLSMSGFYDSQYTNATTPWVQQLYSRWTWVSQFSLEHLLWNTIFEDKWYRFFTSWPTVALSDHLRQLKALIPSSSPSWSITRLRKEAAMLTFQCHYHNKQSQSYKELVVTHINDHWAVLMWKCVNKSWYHDQTESEILRTCKLRTALRNNK